MKADRLGSYSKRSTVAATSNLRRLKSTRRRRCLCPPPMWLLVIRPWLLRPPVFFLPRVSALTGLPSPQRALSPPPRPRLPPAPPVDHDQLSQRRRDRLVSLQSHLSVPRPTGLWSRRSCDPRPARRSLSSSRSARRDGRGKPSSC